MASEIAQKLGGGTIHKALISDDSESFGFEVVVKGDGRGNYNVLAVWVDCDAEGNGPGWLSISE